MQTSETFFTLVSVLLNWKLSKLHISKTRRERTTQTNPLKITFNNKNSLEHNSELIKTKYPDLGVC